MALFDFDLGFGDVARAGAEVFSATERRKSDKEIADANIRQAQRTQEEGLQSYTGRGTDQVTARTPEGGFATDYRPGSIAEQQFVSDRDVRIPRANEAAQNFEFNLDLPGARSVVAEEDARRNKLYQMALNTQQGQIERAYGGVKGRGGGIENTGVAREIARAGGEFALKNQLMGGERGALELLGASNVQDLNTFKGFQDAFGRTSPTYTPPGGAASFIAQTPIPGGAIQPTNLGIGSEAFSNLLGTGINRRQSAIAQAEADRRSQEMIAALGERTIGDEQMKAILAKIDLLGR